MSPTIVPKCPPVPPTPDCALLTCPLYPVPPGSCIVKKASDRECLFALEGVRHLSASDQTIDAHDVSRGTPATPAGTVTLLENM